MNTLRRLCRALIRTFPCDIRQEGFLDLPDLIVQLVADAQAEGGRWAGARTAAWEVAWLVIGSLRAWWRRGREAVGNGLARPISWVVPDLRLFLILALRERGGTIALVSIIAVVSGSTATFVTLGQSIRAESTSVVTADRLAWIWADRTWEPDGTPLVSDIHLGHLRDRSTSFQGLAAMWMVSGPVRGGDRPIHVDVARVSANFFDLLEVKPHLGRLLAVGDDRPGAPWVAVLTFDFWKTHFGGDPDVIGRRVVVGVPDMEVVGVLPEGFRFPQPDALGPYGEPAVWLPTRHRFGGVGLPQDVQAILSLRNVGVSHHVASGEVEELGREADAGLYDHRGFGYRMQSLPSGRSPGLARAMGTIAAALIGMMSVALANVFMLSRARGTRRARVLDVLRLVGGTRRRLALVIGLEAALLGAVGGVAGFCLAVGGLWLGRAAPSPSDSLAPGSLTTWVTVGVVAACAALLAAAHGGAAAVRVLRTATREGRHDTGRSLRADRGVILLQVALALALVVGAAVLDRAVKGAVTGDAGFQPNGLVTFTLYPMPDDYPDGRSRERFLNEVQSHLLAHPEVKSLSSTSALPFSGGSTQVPAGRRRPSWDVDPESFSVAEWTGFDGAFVSEGDSDRSRVVDLNVAQPGFFAALEIPLLRGREFARSDSVDGSRVAIVGDELVNALWHGGDPIGDSLWVIGSWRRVVGVVPHTMLHGLSSGERPQAWIPHSQVQAGRMSLVVATTLPTDTVARLARAAVARVDPGVPVGPVIAVRAMVRAETAEERFVSGIVTVFSCISLLLAGFALYGLTSALVTARRRDIAIRLAMGGRGVQLGMMVVREAALVAMTGATVGGVLYALFDVALDPLAFVGGPSPELGLYLGAAAICLLVGCVAGLGPGRRAAKTDPVVLLTSP